MTELAELPGSPAPPAHAPPSLLPARRPELLLRPLGDKGQYVVKDPLTGDYFNIGEQEHFLLAALDGRQTADGLRAAFEHRFGETITDDDLAGFVDMVSALGFLRPDAAATTAPAPAAAKPPKPGAATQSLLYWR